MSLCVLHLLIYKTRQIMSTPFQKFFSKNDKTPTQGDMRALKRISDVSLYISILVEPCPNVCHNVKDVIDILLSISILNDQTETNTGRR